MKIYGFNAKTAERIKASVRHFETTFRTANPTPPRAKYPVGPGGAGAGLVPLSIQSNVTAGSEAGPSTFTAIIEVASGSGHGWTTTGGSSVTAYNRAPGVSFSASSGSPKVGWGTMIQGVVYLVSADC